MAEELDTINEAIKEHHTIRDTVKFATGAVSDFEALFALRQAYAGWSQSPPDEMAARHQQLIETLEMVDRGLRLHWDKEEAYLRPLLGGPMMKAFILEHRDIARRLEEATKTFSAEHLEALQPQELLARKSAIQDMINHVMQAIEEHSNHEDMIFNMVRKGLEGEKK
jgi:hypothetical protein